MDDSLHAAAERGDTATVRRLVEAGAPVDSRDARGRTALMAATHGNRPETVAALLALGADIDLQDERRDNPFLYAGAEGLDEVLALAIDAGADTRRTNRYGGNALIPAAHHGHPTTVALLLERTDVEVDHVNNLGWTALLEAILLSDGGPTHQRIVGILLAHGADPNLPDGDGVTPRAHAQARGYAQIVAQLDAAGAR